MGEDIVQNEYSTCVSADSLCPAGKHRITGVEMTVSVIHFAKEMLDLIYSSQSKSIRNLPSQDSSAKPVPGIPGWKEKVTFPCDEDESNSKNFSAATSSFLVSAVLSRRLDWI